jgi:hypothetical protein
MKFYGGSMDGRDMAVPERWTIVTIERPEVNPLHYFTGAAVGRFEPLRVQQEHYEVTRFGISRANPRRRKTVSAAVLQGRKSVLINSTELCRELEGKPWEFPDVSMLDEFEEWFAQAWFRQTGKLFWRDRPVPLECR